MELQLEKSESNYQSKIEYLQSKARALRMQISSLYTLIQTMESKIRVNEFRYKSTFSDDVIALKNQQLALNVVKNIQEIIAREVPENSGKINMDLLKSVYVNARQVAESLILEYEKEKEEIIKIKEFDEDRDHEYYFKRDDVAKIMEETQKVKTLFRSLVKYLHPNGMESMALHNKAKNDAKTKLFLRDLFIQAKEAYHGHDLFTLELIYEVVMSLIDSLDDDISFELSEQDWQKTIEKSQKALSMLDKKRQSLLSNPVYDLEFSIDGIARTRQKLNSQVKSIISQQNQVLDEILTRYGVEPRAIQTFMQDILEERI